MHKGKGSVALLGGTFDPIHNGHTLPALSLADQFGWNQVVLQPSFAPPHRPTPSANDEQRLRMVQLAAQDDPRLLADDFELRQGQPTRTVNTLEHLQSLNPAASFNFIMGMDSFLSFTSWLSWQDILQRAHIIVLPRPGFHLKDANPTLLAELAQRQSLKTNEFSQGAGRIYIAETTPINVSATQLRQLLLSYPRQINAPPPPLIAPQVFEYIKEQQLYLS